MFNVLSGSIDYHFIFIRHLISSLLLSNNCHASSNIDNYKYLTSEYNICTIVNGSVILDNDDERILSFFQHICEIIINNESICNIELPDDILDHSASALYEHIVDVTDKLFEIVEEKLLGQEQVFTEFCKFKENVQLSLAVDKERIFNCSDNKFPRPQNNHAWFTPAEINNSCSTPFIPKLNSKFYHKVMLQLVEVSATNIDPQVFAPTSYYMHPYYTELKNLAYPDWQMSEVSVTTPIIPPIESNVIFIDAEAGIMVMLEDIRAVKEVVISLLNHSFRSFQGYCCILQISTRFKDYAIDALVLRQKIGNLLGPICANPGLIKIFHNGQQDILWLQRDFGIYIVNCFDTFEAANLLKYPSSTLSNILKYYGGPPLRAQHEFCDWRIRPIDITLLRGACNNTRYIIYVYDALRNDLNRVYGREGLEAVLNVSRKICLRRYEREPFWPLGYRKLLNIPRKNAPKSDILTDLQDKIMRELWKWRDDSARDLDECVYYVMSNSELLRISSIMPITTASLLENCSPLSLLVIKNQDIIIDIVKGAVKEANQRDSDCQFSPKKVGLSFEENIVYGRALRTPCKELDCVDETSAMPSNNMLPGNSSMYTFTPAVVLAPPSLPLQSPSPVNHISTKYAESPVMPAEDIFKLAGWSTPGSDIINGTVSSPTFDEKYQIKMLQIDGGIEAKKSEKIIDDADASNNIFKKSSHSNDANTSRNIPETFEEIYEISNRNRKRNKDKRKLNEDDENNSEMQREINDVKNNTQNSNNNIITPNIDTQRQSQVHINMCSELSSSLFDEMTYFTYFNQASLDNSVDSTLDFVENLGWIKDCQERSKIKEENTLDSSEL